MNKQIKVNSWQENISKPLLLLEDVIWLSVVYLLKLIERGKKERIWHHANPPASVGRVWPFYKKQSSWFRKKYAFIFIPKLKVHFGNERKLHGSLWFLCDVDMRW